MNEAARQVTTAKEDWFQIALETLIAEGVERVKVLTLTEKLGASRSSFYWFFKNRDDLLAQLLAHWEQKNTKAILERAARPAASITEAVLNVFECWIASEIFDARLDQAVRDWARNDPAVAAAVQAADAARIEALRAMFAAQDYAPGEDFIRARVLYLTQIGYYAIGASEDMETRLSYVGHYLMALTGRRASDAELARFVAYTEGKADEFKREEG
ncbi:MAG: TetR/AcrR family transcriptional regulator [Kiloniellales bacterium]